MKKITMQNAHFSKMQRLSTVIFFTIDTQTTVIQWFNLCQPKIGVLKLLYKKCIKSGMVVSNTFIILLYFELTNSII